jgi:hypothetical protein
MSHLRVVLTTIAVLILLGILSIFILQMVMGILYHDECPIQKMLPWINMVSGSTGILLFIISPLLYFAHRFKMNKCITTSLTVIITVLSLFEIAWTIYGSVTFFKLHNKDIVQHENTTISTYCHQQLYKLSHGTFVTLDVFLALIGCLPLGALAG